MRGTSLVSADITSSAFGTFASETYTLANSALTSALPTYFQLDLTPLNSSDTSNTGELRLVFFGNLSASGAKLSDTSYESQDSLSDTRYITSGSAQAVPEPDSAALLLVLGAALVPLGRKIRLR